MISISEDFIVAAAPNAEAAKNGRGLLLKNKFVALFHSPDQAVVFGHCHGSGKSPYLLLGRLRRARKTGLPLHVSQPAVPLQAFAGPVVRPAGGQKVQRG